MRVQTAACLTRFEVESDLAFSRLTLKGLANFGLDRANNLRLLLAEGHGRRSKCLCDGAFCDLSIQELDIGATVCSGIGTEATLNEFTFVFADRLLHFCFYKLYA